jgi:anaerobic C4-dicarboxylate transporter
MDMLLIWLEFAVLLACIIIGSRYGGGYHPG